jgi:hypothetical protein
MHRVRRTRTTRGAFIDFISQAKVQAEFSAHSYSHQSQGVRVIPADVAKNLPNFYDDKSSTRTPSGGGQHDEVEILESVDADLAHKGAAV